MKWRTRALALTLAAALCSSQLAVPAFAEEPANALTGSLGATLRFDFQQAQVAVEDRAIQVTLYKGDEKIETVPLSKAPDKIGNYPLQVTARNRDGGPLENELYIGYYDLTINNLPVGTYSLQFEGKGYRTYQTKEIEIKDYSQHVIVGTGDATFSIGDLNGDGTVDKDDLKRVSDVLGSAETEFDLDGDGKVDIVDLAYVNHEIGAVGDEDVFATELIDATTVVETDEITNNVSFEAGAAEDLFENNGNTVKISIGTASQAEPETVEAPEQEEPEPPAEELVPDTPTEEPAPIPDTSAEEPTPEPDTPAKEPTPEPDTPAPTPAPEEETEPSNNSTPETTTPPADIHTEKVPLADEPQSGVSLPIPFKEKTELEQIQLVAPDGEGAPQEGTIVVETEDGTKEEIPFNHTLPAGVLALQSSTVTVNLGKRIPVKKITIRIEKVQGDAGYVVMEQIKFLQNIVPENPTPKYNKVQKVSAQPGDKLVNLKWTELPNVDGYRVDYGLSGEDKEGETKVDVPYATVDGLENLKEYWFTVTPVDDKGVWEGDPSEQITATPQPASVPDAPDFLTVKEQDSALNLSWHKSKNATGYRVYYRVKETADWVRIGGDLTALNYMLQGLVNDTTYEMCVAAYNEVGEGKKSTVVEGTPKEQISKEPEGIPTEGRMDRDNFDKVWLTDEGNYSPTSYPADKPFKIENVFDGDYTTHWTSQSYGDGNFSRNKQINCIFKQPMDLGNVIYVPRQDGDYRKNLKTYTITVWQDGDDINKPGKLVAGGDGGNLRTWWPVQNNPSATGFAVLPFEPVEKVKKISINMDQQQYTAISLSELIFLQYDPEKSLDKQITSLFSDTLCTTLRADVTEEDLAALEARMQTDEKNYYLNIPVMQDELALARALFENKQDEVGRVLNGIESRNAGGGQAYNEGQGGSALQPAGVVAKANKDITVYADGIPEGAEVHLVASQTFAEASPWSKDLGTLRNGRNIISIPKIGSQQTERGGSLYLTYSGANPENIRLHFRRTTDIPMLAITDWYSLSEQQRRERIGEYVDTVNAYASSLPKNNIQTQAANVTEISMPHVLLSIPADVVARAIGTGKDASIERLYKNVMAWEQIMDIATYTQGIDNDTNMQARQNIRYMRMFAGAFMYAAGSHIGIGYGSCGGMVSGQPVESSFDGKSNKLFGWGIAHEIGHNMDKLGKAEITNNIYSIMVQTFDGKSNILPSRLENSNVYKSIFEKTAQGYPGAANNVFTQLGMYWQLHLAYDEADKPMEFYHQFFKTWKQGDLNSSYSYDEKFAVTAAKTAGHDLTEFFTRWGMELGDAAKAEIKALASESRALWYLNDDSRRYRLNGGAAATGETTAKAVGNAKNEKQVDITFSSSAVADTLQGFEIRRNDRPIAFVTEGNTYVDTIGSANNQAFTYTVQAYDKLGNEAGAVADAGTIRIAYDKTVPADAYKVAPTTTGAVFKEATAVSGIKITNAPASGSFTVTIKNSGKDTVAKQGDFTKNDAADGSSYYLSYFNKPGTTDTRIWTYDAEEITLEGVPENATVEFVSYAGDNIAFYDDAVMGRLKADYKYDAVDENNQVVPQTIAAGTLVVMGTYRGDPLWNTIRIVGDFTTTKIDAATGEQVQESEERPMAGDVLMFAEIPADGEVSDISDGFFLFIPDVQNEAKLQEGASNCDAVSLLPTRVKAELYRTDTVDSADSKRLTSDTVWVVTPSADSMPEIVLMGDNQ